MQAIVQHADKLYEERKWHEALEYLEQYADTKELDLLWRLMRINYRVGKHITADRRAAERMAARGMELSERALKISDKHFLCQKVHGILQAKLPPCEAAGGAVENGMCGSVLPTCALITQWTAIVLSWYAELQGQKKRIEKSFEVRDHLLVS